MSKFGKNIRKIRNAKNISQSAFADLFNLKRGSIGAYEEGRAEAKFDTVIEIADYFQLTLDQLLRKDLTINEIYHIKEKNEKIKHQSEFKKDKSFQDEGVRDELKADSEIDQLKVRLDTIENVLEEIKILLRK